MELCLVRHGETDWNLQGKLQGQTDIELNTTGILQAEACANYFNIAGNFELIITSPLMRAKRTAEIIAIKSNLPLVENTLLMERNYGAAEGLTPNERVANFPSGDYPDLETSTALTARVMEALNAISSQHQGVQKIIVVAHGAVINCILAEISQGEIGSGITKLANGGLSTISILEDSWYIEEVNVVKHLPLHHQTK